MDDWIIWTAIVAVIFFGLIFPYYSEQECVDGFDSTQGYYKKYCPSCNWRSRNSCSKCTNCGYCVTESGYGECVPGDSSGPYFRDDCAYWEYGDPWENYPYGNAYPVIPVKDVYPFDRWNLRQQRWGWSRQEVGDRLQKQAKDLRDLRRRLYASEQ